METSPIIRYRYAALLLAQGRGSVNAATVSHFIYRKPIAPAKFAGLPH
jgi:hypothetical protein